MDFLLRDLCIMDTVSFPYVSLIIENYKCTALDL